MKNYLKKETKQRQSDPELEISAVDFVSIGIASHAFCLIDNAGILKILKGKGEFTESQIDGFNNIHLVKSALITLVGAKVLHLKDKKYTLSKLGKQLAKNTGLLTLPLIGYRKLFSKQLQLLKNPSSMKDSDIDFAAVALASIDFGANDLDPLMIEVFKAIDPKGTICDLGCGTGEKLVKVCKATNSPGLGIERSSPVILKSKRYTQGTKVEIIKGDVMALKGVWEDVDVAMISFVCHDIPSSECSKILWSFQKNFPRMRFLIIVDIVSFSEKIPTIMPGFDYVHGLQGITPRNYEETIEVFEKATYTISMEENLMNELKDYISNSLSDEKLQLITGQIFIGQAILVAYELGLFKLISKQPLSIQDIARQMGLKERTTQAIISSSCALDLVEYRDDGYQLSQIGKMYLNDENPEYYGKVLDLLIQENSIMNYTSIKTAILSDRGKDLFTPSDPLGHTESFIESLHQKAFKPAFYWPKIIDLKKCKKFVDIGGGSGIHTIAACLHHPDLLGIVCDRLGVISHTKRYIKDFDLESRVEAVELDMWKDPFPEGDVYFFGDIFHDWKREKCVLLAKKCYSFLPKNGQIILHEMLFNNNKTGPLLTSAYNMKMIAWTEGQQFSSGEMQDILQEAGFKEVNIRNSLGNWSLIIGIKR